MLCLSHVLLVGTADGRMKRSQGISQRQQEKKFFIREQIRLNKHRERIIMPDKIWFSTTKSKHFAQTTSTELEFMMMLATFFFFFFGNFFQLRTIFRYEFRKGSQEFRVSSNNNRTWKRKIEKSQNETTLKVYADVVKLLSVLSCSDLSLVHLAHLLSFMILIN